VSINKAVDDLSPFEKDHLFTVLEEKLDYPANLEESVRKKAVNVTPDFPKKTKCISYVCRD
jgi:hypothetical protein